MKVLFYGAGVLGSLYAARMQEAGHEVSILARGQRLVELREHGIRYQDVLNGGPVRETRVTVVDRLDPQDAYDLVVVLVRLNQLQEVLPVLAVSRGTPNLLFMVNNPLGTGEILRQISRERVLLGFAGAGGVREGQVVRYSIAPSWFQQTTIGELTGLRTPRLDRILAAFRQAGFVTTPCQDMDAWLKTHAAWVVPVAEAIYLSGGSVRRLAHTRDALVLLVRAVREDFQVLRALGVPVTPARHLFWQLVPEPLLVSILSRALDSRLAEVAMEQHANAARKDEIPCIAQAFRALVRRSRIATPAGDELAQTLIEAPLALPSGSKSLSLDWRSTVMATWIVLVLLRVGRFFQSRFRK